MDCYGTYYYIVCKIYLGYFTYAQVQIDLHFIKIVYKVLINWFHEAILKKLEVTQAVMKMHAFYGTYIFITISTRVCHWTLSWAI
jgi:hypothetical protein